MKYVYKILSTEAFKDFFTITNENDDLDWEQVIVSFVQLILISMLFFSIGVIWYFFF